LFRDERSLVTCSSNHATEFVTNIANENNWFCIDPHWIHDMPGVAFTQQATLYRSRKKTMMKLCEERLREMDYWVVD